MGSCESKLLYFDIEIPDLENKDSVTSLSIPSSFLFIGKKIKVHMYMSSHLKGLFTLKLFYYCNSTEEKTDYFFLYTCSSQG